jgi:hypothetical protein
MTATGPTSKRPTVSRHERSSEVRSHAAERPRSVAGAASDSSPAAGAHAAPHLTNEDATPGAGVLPSHAHRSGKEVDSGAG